MIAAESVAEVMGLRQPIHSLAELAAAVTRGLPKSALRACVRRVVDDRAEQRRLMFALVPEATFKRRQQPKPLESERIERLGRVIATAEYVWGDRGEAKRFLTMPHAAFGGRAPDRRGAQRARRPPSGGAALADLSRARRLSPRCAPFGSPTAAIRSSTVPEPLRTAGAGTHRDDR